MSGPHARLEGWARRNNAGPFLAAVTLATHLFVNAVSPYGWQRDEFLYFAMGEHLRLWRMDFPPLIAIVANASRMLGDSLVATRIVPALGHAALVWAAAWIARELSGRNYAQWLAALAVFTSALFMRSGTLLQPVILDQVWWTAALACTLLLARSGNPRWWLGVGAALGLGLLTKFSIAFIALPLAVGLLVSPSRRWFGTRWPYIAALLTLALGLPSLTGQVLLGAPVLGQMRDLQESQLAHVTPLAFLGEQLTFSPVFVPLGAWGLVRLLRRGETRAVGIACAGAVLLLLVTHGKAYYAGPIYPTLFAAGAVAMESVSLPRGTSTLRAAVVVAVLIVGVIAAPFGYPIVPPDAMARYAQRLGVTPAVRTNRGEVLPLPQDYADMLGWEELVRAVSNVYRALPAQDRPRAVIFGDNYGRAGAVDFFRKKYRLPRSISVTGSYWFFGPGELPGDVLISVGGDREGLDRYYASVVAAAMIGNLRGVPEEQSVTVWVCRGRKGSMSLQSLWPQLAGRN